MTSTPQNISPVNMSDQDLGKVLEVGIPAGERVVISGMSGLYPNARHVKDLADILYNKINPITSVDSRWTFKHSEMAGYTGKVPDLNLFDAHFFKVNYQVGNCMDSMCRKILEHVHMAIYDAGINPEQLNGKKVGVYIGANTAETENVSVYMMKGYTKCGFALVGCNKSMFANRISYWLNTKGPSMSVNQDCCSSTGALELAYQALMRGDCESAIVGGCSLCLHPQSLIHYGRLLKLSKDDKIKSFDQNADGSVIAEAINVLFLQKAKHALRIYAEIVNVKTEFSTLVNNETGPRFGFYRNSDDIIEFLKRFYEESNIPPQAVEYIEGCGSAVPETDKAELEAYEKIFCVDRINPLLVGSVMSNIGNVEAASGIAAITKILLGYHTGALAGNLHCDTPRRDVMALQDGRMSVVRDHVRFGHGYTAVNGFSISGVNSHLLLKGHLKPKDLTRYKSAIPQLVLISGRQDTAVDKILKDLTSRPIDLEEIALLYNAHSTRISGHLGRGYTILDKNEENKTISLCEKSGYFDYVKRPIWFVYSGMGSQYNGMGVDLMRIPVFASAIERCHRALQPKGIDIVHIITSFDESIFNNVLHSFVGIAAIQIGLTDILKQLGIIPDKIIGHSVGELGCAYADECLSTEEMILSAYSRGLVSIQTPFIHGSMAAVGIGYQQILPMCPPEIEVACHNSSESCTISGPADVMHDYVANLVKKNIFVKEVPCSNIAYHSRYISCAGPVLLKYLKEVIKTPKLRSERWVSTSVPMDKWNEPNAKYSSAEYYTNNLLSSVLFEETSRLIPSNAILVEIAPHGLLQSILKRSLPQSCTNIPLTRRGCRDNAVFLLEAIGKLYMEGLNPKIQSLYPTIEFPVSTGTPMLSHLIEWAHQEKWPLPLYLSGTKQTASATKNIISLHDEEHKYLQGHVIGGKILYPCAAVLVAVWDTLVMALNMARRRRSVQFRDVMLHVQPIIHDRRQLTIGVTVQRGTGRFEVTDDMNSKIASGFIIIEKNRSRIFPEVTETVNMTVSSNEIYDHFLSKDFAYKDSFKSILSMNLSLTEARIVWCGNWVTFIDGMFQLLNLRHSYDSFSLPHYISKLSINPDEQLEYNDIIKTATVLEAYNLTKCGGIVMENVVFKEIPKPIDNTLSQPLRSIKFIPHFTSNQLNYETIVQVYLQIVAENVGMQTINILGIYDNQTTLSQFNEIKRIIDEVPRITAVLTWLERDSIREGQENLTDVNLILTYNLATDDYIVNFFYEVLKHSTFVINVRDSVSNACHLSKLCQVVCEHIINSTHALELVRWQPTDRVNISFVNAPTDLALPIGDLVNAITINSVSGGEYYVPVHNVSNAKANMMLQSSLVGQKESFKWVQASSDENLRVAVKVHYAALNDLDPKRHNGLIPYNTTQRGFGMDFSGITESGTRVMGLVECGAVSTVIQAEPDFLWPVPEHWSLEDAATVPFSYCLAYYCLTIKNLNIPGVRVLVHGGAGGLGQAVISLALANHCEVFATVGDVRKKKFLLKMYPKLKDENIGNSRDTTLRDLVLNITNGKGVDIIISTVKGEPKADTFKCLALRGVIVDVSQRSNSENFEYGMYHLDNSKSYVTVDFLSIFKEKRNEMRKLQRQISDGIAKGWVRPLSRITYGPKHVSRAFQLLAGSNQRGRVLLSLQQTDIHALNTEPRLQYTSKNLHIIISDHKYYGQQIADMIINRGVRKLLIKLPVPPEDFKLKIRQWQGTGVEVSCIYTDIADVPRLFTDDLSVAVEGIYIIITNKQGSVLDTSAFVEAIDAVSRKMFSDLKYFVIINTANSVGEETCTSRSVDGLAATMLKFSEFKDVGGNDDQELVSVHDMMHIVERAIISEESVLSAHIVSNPKSSLLTQVATVAGVSITTNVNRATTLSDLGMDIAKADKVSIYLRDTHNIFFTVDEIIALTVERIENIDQTLTRTDFEYGKGLNKLFTFAEADEIVATTEMVFMPTLRCSATWSENEFDVSLPYLCIVPGIEGHHGRFRTLCERLKLPALVLQPDLTRPNETIPNMARRYAEILSQKAGPEKHFYLLGYEGGVFIVLEMAAILEKYGFTTLVYCIGNPEDIKREIQEHLKGLETTEDLQNTLIRHMFVKMTNSNIDELDLALKGVYSWTEKLNVTVKTLLRKVSHSAQYTRQLIVAAYERIMTLLQYELKIQTMQSQLILLLPMSDVVVDQTALQRYSKQSVLCHQLRAPLSQAVDDLRCATIINAHLDVNILEEFEKKNLCESYVIDSDAIMSLTTCE